MLRRANTVAVARESFFMDASSSTESKKLYNVTALTS